mmetsp:Transcript_25783/g.39512  ORF Transcript_25783/g.39512 Transcript_25783/m.39512 type:complete len:83 (+) Transcript_25783:242-490(+)
MQVHLQHLPQHNVNNNVEDIRSVHSVDDDKANDVLHGHEHVDGEHEQNVDEDKPLHEQEQHDEDERQWADEWKDRVRMWLSQ